MGTGGDSLLVAFPDAAEAVAACVEGQLAMSAHHWPPGAEIQVRMGVHTGEASPSGDNYVALPLHQVARIAAGAHGGQILVSQATATAAEGRASAEDAPGRPRVFSATRFRCTRAPWLTLTSVTNSRRCAHRGPGPQPALPPRQLRRAGRGPIGACRLAGHNRSGHRRRPWGRREDTPAVQVAFDLLDDFDDGAWLVELAPLSDSASVSRTVASAMGIAEVPA